MRIAFAIFVVVAAGIESGSDYVIRSRVATSADWVAATSHVRRAFQKGDQILTAPSWSDATTRMHLGDLISLEMAGAAPFDVFNRTWVLSIRGERRPEESTFRKVAYEHEFGRVTVRRYDNDLANRQGEDAVLYKFVENLRSARVEIVSPGAPGGARECPFTTTQDIGTGGLGQGSLSPRGRFTCDGSRPGLWVGETVIEDMSLAPRTCIWQHPQGEDPVRVTFPVVPRGKELVIGTDLYYEHQRGETGADITLVVRSGAHEIGRIVHRDGDGFITRAFALPQDLGAAMPISVETTSANANLRSICWSGIVRGAR